MTTSTTFQIAPATRMANVSYAIRDLAVVADQVARQGHKILYLNIGDPCTLRFPHSPAHDRSAVNAPCTTGFNGYGDSLGERSAVAAIRAQAEARGFKNIQGIMVGFGSGEVIDHCLTALINPGDNVLTPCPDYPLYGAVLGKLSAEPNPYFLSEENGWQPDLEDIAARINPRTKAILLINPNNPDGRHLLARHAGRHCRTGAPPQSAHPRRRDLRPAHHRRRLRAHLHRRACAGRSGHHLQRTLARHTSCPAGALAGPVATGPAESLSDYLEAVYKLLRARLSAPHPFMHAIAPALKGPQDHLNVVRAKLRRRRDLTVEWAARTPRVSLTAPQGAFYAFPKLDIPEDDMQFVTELAPAETCAVRSRRRLRTTKPGTRHMRIVFLPQEEVLHRGLRSITEFIAQRY